MIQRMKHPGAAMFSDCRNQLALALLTAVMLGCLLGGCRASQPATLEKSGADRVFIENPAADRVTAFRVRSDAGADLNADHGWAAATGENAMVPVEQPFRIRFEVEAGAPANEVRRYRLQYSRNGGPWLNLEAADFPFPVGRTPRVSVISSDVFESDDETSDLLPGSSAPFRDGAGVSLLETTASWIPNGSHGEWEWPIVIRRWADGAVTNEEGDTFEFRMAEAGGRPLGSAANPVITVTVPRGLLAGTFVETPGRIGPWQASNGDLYFLMEPAETYNVLMVVKSEDGGETWQEADAGNRPATGDLEGFAASMHDDTIHMLHQTSDEVLHHSFRTSDHANPDTWDVRDDTVATPGEPPTQVASLAVRSDGSLVAAYGGPEKIHYSIRSPEGKWGADTVVDEDSPRHLSGPQVVAGENDVVHLAYNAQDGTAWYRTIQPDGSLAPSMQLATGLGTSEYDAGSILPLVMIPKSNMTVVIYRLATGELWERRVTAEGALTDAVKVSDLKVVQNAVDSDQTGADAIAYGENVHVLFIEDGTGRIYHTRSAADRRWEPADLVVDGVTAQWIRGNVLTHGGPVYGFVYDAGSDGGSGMNRYAEIPLGGAQP